jgi:hypothetical protein
VLRNKSRDKSTPAEKVAIATSLAACLPATSRCPSRLELRDHIHRLDSVYGVVLAVTLWMTIDLDYRGIGIIRVINRPVVDTLAAMK